MFHPGLPLRGRLSRRLLWGFRDFGHVYVPQLIFINFYKLIWVFFRLNIFTLAKKCWTAVRDAERNSLFFKKKRSTSSVSLRFLQSTKMILNIILFAHKNYKVGWKLQTEMRQLSPLHLRAEAAQRTRSRGLKPDYVWWRAYCDSKLKKCKTWDFIWDLPALTWGPTMDLPFIAGDFTKDHHVVTHYFTWDMS